MNGSVPRDLARPRLMWENEAQRGGVWLQKGMFHTQTNITEPVGLPIATALVKLVFVITITY